MQGSCKCAELEWKVYETITAINLHVPIERNKLAWELLFV